MRVAGSTSRPGAAAVVERARSEDRPDPGDELARAERLGEVVVGPDREADQFVDLLGLRGQHDDVGVAERADLAADLDAVDPRQHQVEDDDIWMLGPSHLERHGPVACGQDLPALAGQIAAHEFHHRWLVIDDEDPCRAHASACARNRSERQPWSPAPKPAVTDRVPNGLAWTALVGYSQGVSEREPWNTNTTASRRHAAEHHAAGHDRHEGHSVAMFRDKFGLSLALTIPIVLLSPEVAGWIGYTTPAIPGIEYVPADPRHDHLPLRRARLPARRPGELADRQPGMMTLISLAIIVAFVTSLGRHAWPVRRRDLVGARDADHDHAAGPLAGDALDRPGPRRPAALADLLPDTAERVTASGTEEVPIAAARVGDVVLVRPGGRVPVDGLVVEGTADVDESMITGESRAVPKEPGDTVVAGTVAGGGSLRVRVTATGDATALSGIMRLVAAAQASASRAQALADRAAAILFYVALGCRRDHLGVLVAAGRPGRRPHPNGDRPRHRLPSCPGPRDPAGDRHLDLPWRS